MRYYFAPMEGLTDSIYRRLHHQYFPGVTRYYTPFFSPTVHRALTLKEERELPLAQENDFTVIPQLLTKSPEDFLWMAQAALDRGYEEVNLNLGCPSGTVVAKGKGSGMLGDLEALDRFLERIYHDAPLPVSIKTRLGLELAQEFSPLLEVFNRYPIAELIIHPRVRRQFYTGEVNQEMFSYAYENSRNPICYNGDILSLSQAEALQKAYPRLEAVMIGRGLLRDPGMLSGRTDIRVLRDFMDDLLEGYTEAFGSRRNAMFRLKENWSYLHTRFEGSEKLWKRLRKTTDIEEFLAVSHEILETLPLREA